MSCLLHDLSPIVIHQLIRNMSSTTGATSGAGTCYPSRTQLIVHCRFFGGGLNPSFTHQWCNGECVCWCVVAVRFELRSDQTKNYKIGFHRYFVKHATYMGKSRIRIWCPNGATCLLDDYKTQIKHVGLVQSGYHYHRIVMQRVLSMISVKNCPLGGKQKQALTHYW